jgi:hypothetical protein
MAASDFVTTLHTKTAKVSTVPRRYVDTIYPDLFKELSEAQIIELRRKEEMELYGEYRTPSPKSAAAAAAKAAAMEEGVK